ncbi:hypothetical protein SL267_04850 [Serratia marcescens]|nr:hypothetical protein SL267_04850 [Serratia marcescens]
MSLINTENNADALFQFKNITADKPLAIIYPTWNIVWLYMRVFIFCRYFYDGN